MEQRIQKLNNSEQLGMEDSLPFPIEALRAAPTTFLGNESVILAATLESTLLTFYHQHCVTPEISQPNLVPSISRINPPNGPKTPIQQFIHKSRKSKNKEPKYIRSQPDHPDPQSVLRTRTRQGYKP